jgi:hypothetical protein
MNSARRLDFRLYGIRPPQLAAARWSDEETDDALYDARGPVFIRETRCGYKNRPIQLLRFRLVTACAENDRTSPRLTRVGRILDQTGRHGRLHCPERSLVVLAFRDCH